MAARRLPRTAALLVCAALALVTATAAPASAGAHAAGPPRTLLPDDAAAGWLARQLVDGEHFEGSSTG